MAINPKNQQVQGHEFFDPKTPRVPIEVLGIPTEPLMDLSQALGTIAFIDPSKTPYPFTAYGYRAKYSADKVLSLFPLIERIQSGDEIGPQDVRPYRKPIKRLVSKLNTADRLAALSSGLFFVGIPIRKTINRRIEEEFPERIAPFLNRANEYLPQAEPYVEFFSQFDNPREQFVSEVAVVASNIRNNSRARAQRNGRSSDVWAEDAAFGIRKTIEEILSDEEGSKQRMPMFSHFVIEQLPKEAPLPSSDVLGVAAPEIISALDAALPIDQRDAKFLNNILSHPHPKRWLADLFKGRQLESVREVATLLLPSIRDLLPTSGQEVRDIFERVKKFLKTDPRKTKQQ